MQADVALSHEIRLFGIKKLTRRRAHFANMLKLRAAFRVSKRPHALCQAARSGPQAKMHVTVVKAARSPDRDAAASPTRYAARRVSSLDLWTKMHMPRPMMAECLDRNGSRSQLRGIKNHQTLLTRFARRESNVCSVSTAQRGHARLRRRAAAILRTAEVAPRHSLVSLPLAPCMPCTYGLTLAHMPERGRLQPAEVQLGGDRRPRRGLGR